MHKTVVIICDGRFPKSEYPRYLIRTADFIICCDGALLKFLRNSQGIFGEKRLPDLVIGDMDTLPISMQRRYADIIIKENEQDHNDQTKAVRWVLANLDGTDPYTRRHRRKGRSHDRKCFAADGIYPHVRPWTYCHRDGN